MKDILKLKWDGGIIESKRKQLAYQLLKASSNVDSETFGRISADDLKLLFQLYDKIFFCNWFRECFKGQLKFSLSRRMTKSAALTLCPKNIDKIKPEELVIEIRIGVDFFFQYDMVKGNKKVGGIETNSSLEALQLVFEHELCHVIEFIHFHKSSCKGERFKSLTNGIFGHTESCHGLPTHKQIANQQLGIKIGDTISFTYEGKRLIGIIYNINKRATVMVEDKNGPLADRQGVRYSKYYVPLKLLE